MVLVHVVVSTVAVTSRAMTRTEVVALIRPAIPSCNCGITNRDGRTAGWAELHVRVRGGKASTTGHGNSTVVHDDWRSSRSRLFNWVMGMCMVSDIRFEVLDIDDALLWDDV